MAVDMFMKIEGCSGESADAKHKGEIDVLSWSWGCSNTGTFHQGSGGGAGKANVQDLCFTSYLDKSTADLIAMCLSGKHVGKAVLTLRKAGGADPLEFCIITLTDVFVSSHSVGGSGTEERLTTNTTLNFAKCKMEYFLQTKTGSKEVGSQVGWDIAANQKM